MPKQLNVESFGELTKILMRDIFCSVMLRDPARDGCIKKFTNRNEVLGCFGQSGLQKGKKTQLS